VSGFFKGFCTVGSVGVFSYKVIVLIMQYCF